MGIYYKNEKSSAGDSAKFKIMDAKLHVPIVTSSTTNNINLTKQLNEINN